MSSNSVRENEDHHRGHRKRGRQELRKIKRSSGRRTEDVDADKIDYVAEEAVGRNDNDAVSDVGSEDDLDVGDEDEKKKKVYDALLTILKSEHPELKRMKTKTEESSDRTTQSDGNENAESEPVDDQLEIENGLWEIERMIARMTAVKMRSMTM